MNSIDLLILDGPPAAGKSCLAKVIASELRTHETAHTVIEMDDLAKIYPLSLLSIMYKNLASIWPNYEALVGIKVIIPTYMQQGEREIVMESAPAMRTTICEVVVPAAESARRITEREPDETTRKRLMEYLDGYHANRTPEEHIDFMIQNFNRPIEQVAREVINHMDWLPNS